MTTSNLSIDMCRILSETHPISTPRWKSSHAYWPAFLATVAGAGILIYWLQVARPLWVDEEMLALNARDHTFAELRGPLWLDQSAPLGWLAIERVALLTLGASEPAARSINTLFGIAMLVAAAWIGRRWMTPVGALVLTLLCALGEWLVFFVLELKHYSADAFGTLLLVGVAAWTAEPNGTARSDRRAIVWWIVAAAALWFSNGALFVTPGIAVALVAIHARRSNWTAACWTIAGGLVWLISFALSYQLLLRHTLDNPYLENYWAFAFPPTGHGLAAIVRWTFGLATPLALKPAGTTLWIPFWTAVLLGIAYAIVINHPLGSIVATVPISALMLALFRIVPPFERLAIWMVPSLYIAVALSADAAVRLVSRPRPHSAMKLAIALVLTVAAVATAANIVQRGYRALEVKPLSNYGLDDRRSIAWLRAAVRPGDVVMTTHFGLAGLWWYGGHDISKAEHAGRLPNDVPLFEVGHEPSASECATREAELRAVLNGHSRVVVYLGFRLNVLPPGFDYLVLDDFGRRGDLVGYRRYAEESRIAVFDLTRPPQQQLVIPGESSGGERPAEFSQRRDENDQAADEPLLPAADQADLRPHPRIGKERGQ
jgi:hypothetical protein